MLSCVGARGLARAVPMLVLLMPLLAEADATPVPTALLARRGLTAGGHDHFHGQLSPSGEEIYFAANANRTVEIFVQSLDRGSARVLFDESAEVSQPRLSPDGARLLYISYQQDADGDACIYDIRRRRRRCLTRPGTAVLHVFWYPDGESIGVLTRARLDAPHVLRRMRADGRGGEGEVVLTRDMSAPTISPDGRFLVYVPLERGDDEAGSRRLSRASPGLVFHRLGEGGGPVVFEPALPGTSAFPAFARDGRYLYFTQYLNDTTFDGVIDGDDNGVLFRVAFDASAAEPARAETYEQLTTGGSNCQYPAPAHDRLIATCARAGYLQIYAMPLSGLAPQDWSAARVESEIATSRDPWEQLFLLQWQVSRERDRARRKALYQRIVTHHLALREYESADYYLGSMRRLMREDSTLSGLVSVLQELVDHRREEQRLGHGNLNLEFVEAQRERLERLEALFASEDTSTRRLAHLVESEIYLVLGDKAAALAMFEDVDVEGETSQLVLQAWAMLAEALFRDMGDRERWMAVHRRLSEHPALDERDRLYHARAYVRVIARGRTPGAERPLLAQARARAPEGSTRALMLDLELVLLRVPELGEEASERELERLWRSAPTFERHRALALTTIERAARRDWGRLLHVFGRRWLEDVPEDHPERRYAESLYEEVMLERAYVELRHRRVGEARARFRQITEDTPSLEAHIGYIEASLRLGEGAEGLLREYRERYASADPIEAFAEAYIVSRGLAEERDPERHAAQIERARALLRPVAEVMPRSPEVHHLYAYLAHRHFHRTGEGEAARAAHDRYHLALDLAVNEPRRRASILDELGLLQAALGNHRIALRHFAARERLPFVDPHDELSFRLAKARSLFHAASYEEARAESARAIALVEREPELLGRYRPVVLDRAALYSYASGAHDEAASLYEALVDATESDALAVRMKARLGLGASALAAGQSERARAALEEARALLDAEEPFRRETRRGRVASHFDRDDYRPLVAGLLAWSRRATGDLPGAADALEERRELYRERHLRFGRDAYLLEIARASQQLAEIAYRRGDLPVARRYVEEGIVVADAHLSRAELEVDEVTLALVRAAVELHVYGGLPLSDFAFDVHARLRDAYALITRRRNPRWAEERFLFAMYLTILDAQAR